jgi:ABC-type sugar transport system ATPase subunit
VARIELDGVTKTYPGATAPAVADVTETIQDGEFFVLLGPSGCGKSTLLKLLAGLEHPTSGRIYIGGALSNYVEPRKRNVALVFQNYALYPSMTVRQNVRFPLKMAGTKGPEAERAVLAAAEPLGLEPLLDRGIGQLSGGESQRVALARAIVRSPSVTLMDEPLSNLDALLRLQTREQLLRLHRRVPGTVVYVTHDQIEAMTMGDRIAVMQHGRLAQVGTPVEVYSRPANRFVAGFLGSPSMNFLEGEVVRENGRVAFVSEAMRVELCADSAPAADAANALGFRPESVTLRPSDDGDEAWVTEFVEYLGTEYLVSLRRHGASIRARAPLGCHPEAGARLVPAIDPAAIHLFGADGQRVKTR